MSYPAPTVADLAAFSGRGAATFTAFAASALAQAALMFQFATGLHQLPDDPDKAKLAGYAIMEMADRIYLEQPYAANAASPFQSETIGSYTYSKGSSFYEAAKSGKRVGLWWWDLAVGELGLPGVAGAAAGGSIKVFEEEIAYDAEGNKGIISAADEDGVDAGVGFWNANSSFRLG
jgi:hypothetical protein